MAKLKSKNQKNKKIKVGLTPGFFPEILKLSVTALNSLFSSFDP
jgi:hypothetical protein